MPTIRLKDDTELPQGKTCGNCIHYNYCKKLFECKSTNTYCDWSPSRFQLNPWTYSKVRKIDNYLNPLSEPYVEQTDIRKPIETWML